MEWVLILAMYSGPIDPYTSISLLSVDGFDSEAQCIEAGNKTKGFETKKRSTRFVCVRRGQEPSPIEVAKGDSLTLQCFKAVTAVEFAPGSWVLKCPDDDKRESEEK